MGGSHSAPTELQHARIVCLDNHAAFVLDAKVWDCPELGEPHRGVNQQVCFDLSKCGGNNEGKTFTIQTVPVADVGCDDTVQFQVQYSKFYDQQNYRLSKTELDYNIDWTSTTVLDLPSDNCQDDFCYTILANDALTWWASNDLCKTNGGHLTSIHSDQQNSFIADILTSADTTTWIGLSRPKEEGYSETDNQPWHWDDESPVDYLSWAANEPSYSEVCTGYCTGIFGGEHYCCHNDREYVGEMDATGEWNDAAPELHRHGLCQVPASIVKSQAPIH